jgi:hypothetical protein
MNAEASCQNHLRQRVVERCNNGHPLTQVVLTGAAES